MASASDDNSLRLWDVDHPESSILVPRTLERIRTIAYCGNKFAVVGIGGEVGTLDTKDITAGIRVIGRHATANSISFSLRCVKHGRIALTSAGGGQFAELWDLDKGEHIGRMPGKEIEDISGADIDSQGKRIATISGKRIYLWSWNDRNRYWERDKVELVSPATIQAISFDSSGNHLATGSVDKVVRYWGTDGRLLREFFGHERQIRAVAFAHNGGVLISGSDDATIRLWDLSPEHAHSHDVTSILDDPRRQYARCLTPAQRRRYYLTPEPPRWCIAGEGGASLSPNTWRAKWPYDTGAWRDWLMARDRGEKPELPEE